ncbi:hypothetical protein SmJEL517_g03054 [Synchytrium microbalum]|uniref:Translocon-associated protein subunit beta n=1 Tax=Synchytrium microbalum TaxID=1806994 RepID=A0A507C4Z7_9FUNG|nr:uncharacterized protein SmJEL517_g03054 [Synchytrium microbalum]TPX34189.1 hypothetical protein SmJEL517_g03054 [Synchytrium microbalum]
MRILLLLAAFISLVCGTVLVSKEIEQEYFVQGRPTTVKVSVFNLGPEVITNVILNDKSFKNHTQFTIQEGSTTSTTFPKVNIAANATFSYVVVAAITGPFQDEPVAVHYTVNNKKVTAWSSSLGAVYIATEQEYATISSHTNEWLIFAGLASLPIVVPYVLYSSSVGELRPSKKTQ